MTATEIPARVDTERYPQLSGFDHLEWWVGNARHSAAFFEATLGFEVVGYRGPETGQRDSMSYALRQGNIQFVVTGSLRPDGEIADKVRTHGDGVRDVAFIAEDAEESFNRAVANGAKPVHEPHTLEDDQGVVKRASVATYGDTIHSFIQRQDYAGAFLPNFEAVNLRSQGAHVGLGTIDHVVANIERGHLDEWVGYYRDVFGMARILHFDDDQISTQYSALMSSVVSNGNRITMPINEPADGRKKSQIEEYLDYYGSPGVQHVAMLTHDIVSAVKALRTRGLRFLDIYDTYYEDAKVRMAEFDIPWDDVQAESILVDQDPWGHLLQIFTENIASRPTVFFEVIERHGAQTFGEGNFKALFESIERAQARRGNL